MSYTRYCATECMHELPWPFWYVDAYLRPWLYIHPRTLGLEMLMGMLFFYGAICFVVGSFSDSSPWVRSPLPWPTLLVCPTHAIIMTLRSSINGFSLGSAESADFMMAVQFPPLDDVHRGRFWLVYVTFCVGSYFFTASCVIQTVLGVNQDWEARIATWKSEGGRKPRCGVGPDLCWY
jgi:hypothetical protein